MSPESSFPLLRLRDPAKSNRPRGGGGGGKLFLPGSSRQRERIGPQFSRLSQVISSSDEAALSLRADPSSIAPERAIVFEIAGTLKDFYKAAQRIPGLEYFLEQDIQFDADEDFAAVDERTATKGSRRTDKPIGGKLYLAMPDLRALKELLRLYAIWNNEQKLPRNFAVWGHLFSQLRSMRPWGAEDRILPETLEYWRESLAHDPNRPVRTEFELWFHSDTNKRDSVHTQLTNQISQAGGEVVHFSIISEIAYHAVLADIPASQVQQLLDGNPIAIAQTDEVMFIRPQATCSISESDEDSESVGTLGLDEPTELPIAALLDAVPVQQHSLLVNRLVVDDPEELESRAVVAQRSHGTAMASLIIHGDLNRQDGAIRQMLYVRPVMFADSDGVEKSQPDQLLVDTIYRAVVRMKEGSGDESPTAPTVAFVNLSLGDPRRAFAGVISPWARLLDHLANRYNLLFFVSAGNVYDPILFDSVASWSDIENLSHEDREKLVLRALDSAKGQRTLLSPSESLNSVTVGALHCDAVQSRTLGSLTFDPYVDDTLPSVITALGLGYKRVAKPDVFLPGGRIPLRFQSSGNGSVSAIPVRQSGRQFGLKAASPDRNRRGVLNDVAYSAGTSASTALATRFACLISDSIVEDGERLCEAVPPEYLPVLVKALLLHRSRWGSRGQFLEELFGPHGTGKHNERRDNITRFLGFGGCYPEEVLSGSHNRATLYGYGSIGTGDDEALTYRIPLPPSLIGELAPRSLSVTVAWLSPVNPRNQSYRAVQIEAGPGQDVDLAELVGVQRLTTQPTAACLQKGTVFLEHFTGTRAAAFVDGDSLSLRIWCKETAAPLDQEIRYGIAISLECEADIKIYEQVRDRIRGQVEIRG
jgi:hypothetical protein